ncbi:hypothetical protein D3C72_958430 [compost metagenome]
MARPHAQGSQGNRAGHSPQRASPATRPYSKPATRPMCWPEITSRCTVPVACNVCQSSRARPAPSPSTSATNAACRPLASTASRRWRSVSRQPPATGASNCPALTVPVAPTRRASNCASRSGPCGLSSPAGRCKVTASRHCSPARSGGPSNQLSCRRCGSSARRERPASSSKRTPCAVRVGRPTTRPSSHKVRPSSPVARRSSSACCANQQAQHRPNRKKPSGHSRVNRPRPPTTASSTSHPTDGNAGRKPRHNSPSASANIPVRMK